MAPDRGIQLDLLAVLEADVACQTIKSPPAPGALARTAWANASVATAASGAQAATPPSGRRSP